MNTLSRQFNVLVSDIGVNSFLSRIGLLTVQDQIQRRSFLYVSRGVYSNALLIGKDVQGFSVKIPVFEVVLRLIGRVYPIRLNALDVYPRVFPPTDLLLDHTIPEGVI